MNSLVRAVRRLAENSTARSVLQEQVDRITRADTKSERNAPGVWDGGPRALESGAAEPGASVAGGVGAIFGSLAGGVASLKGLNELGRQLHLSGSWLDGVHQLVGQLSPEQLRTAAQEAVTSLPDAVRADLLGRLSGQVDRVPYGDAADLPGVVSGFLREHGGAQQLLGLLVSSKAPVPGGGALNLIAAMKDPSVRELARSLISALVSVKGRGMPG